MSNWNTVLSSTRNLNDVLIVLQKVLALLQNKADVTTIDEALNNLNSLDGQVSGGLQELITKLGEFDITSSAAIQEFQQQQDQIVGAAQSEISSLQDAINIAAAAGAGANGWTDKLVEMTGGGTLDIFASEQINKTDGLSTIATMLQLENPKTGDRYYVKSFNRPNNLALAQPYKGGGYFIFNENKININDGITIFNGWERQYFKELTPEMSGAVGDGVTDDADALILCITKSYELGLKKAVLGAYTYKSTKELPVLCGNSYYRKGVGIVGQGKDATYIKFEGVNGFRFQRGGGLTAGQIANGFVSDMTIENLGGKNSGHIGITGGDNMTGFSASRMNFISWSYATKFDGTFYICSMLDLFASTCLNGFHTGITGTTLYIDRCYVQSGGDTTATAVPSAFKLNAIYSHVGALACDNYAGTAYNFDFGGGFAASLGVERSITNTNPNASMFVFTNTNWTIGYVYLYRTKGLVGTNRIFNNVNSTVNILTSRIHENDQSITSCDAVYSRVYSDNSASQFARTTFNSERLDVSFADYNPSVSSLNWRVGSNLDAIKYIHGNKRPFIGLYDKQQIIDKKFGASLNMAKTSLWFDVYGGSFRYAGYDGSQDYRYNVAPLLADWGIQRRPDLHGIAAVVNLKEGATDINSIAASDVAVVPLVARKKVADAVNGAVYINTATKAVEMFVSDEWVTLSPLVTIKYGQEVNFPSIAANTVHKTEIAMAGVTVNHYAEVVLATSNTDYEIWGKCLNGSVIVYVRNLSTEPLDLPNLYLRIRAYLIN